MTTYPVSSGPPQSPIRVILVEDDDDLREGLAEYLRLRALSVTDVPSGLAFYKALRTQDFDVAVLDVNLPDTNGFELARDIAAERTMGVIMLTARTGREDRIHGYAQGADLYLTKPVDSEELVLAIRNLARRINAAALERKDGGTPVKADVAPPAPHAPWQLDLQHHSLISPAGHVLKLSGREMMVLEQLARAEGAIVSRAGLTTMLGYDALGAESRGLDAVLRRVRRKAQEHGLELPVFAVHAIGLRFSAPLIII